MFNSKFKLVALLLITLSVLSCGKTPKALVQETVNLPNTPNITPLPLNLFECGNESFVSDTFVGGSINAQNNWFADPSASFDEEIVDLGSEACRGRGVWRISNRSTSLAFGNQPQSPPLAHASGESTVRDIGGGDSMSASFFIRSVSSSADGSSFTMSFSPTSADRHNYLRFLNDDDADGGFHILAIDGVNLDQSHDVASNLERNKWHHILVTSNNPDGFGNDIIKVYLNGALISTHSTWEDWRGGIPATTLNITRLLFRLSGTAASIGSFSNPEGFYFDDLKQWSFNSNDPATIIDEYKTGFEL